MKTYVMSDLHGEYLKFKKMLKKIKFNPDEDKLYILGDAIDRGDGGLDIIEEIRNSKNNSMELIMGNHEYMMLDFFENPYTIYNWLERDGQITYQQILEKGEGYKLDLIDYIKNLKDHIILDQYVLIHGGFFVPGNSSTLEEALKNSNLEERVENRDFFISNKEIENFTVISGHTTTGSLGKKNIIHKKGKILIDCGCGFSDGKLACLRLNDLKEFYIK